jgi:hypothetical protein
MRGKILTVCEVCGGSEPSGTADFLVFHCLTFCSPDCLADYRSEDEARRDGKRTAFSAAEKPARRSRAA